MKKIFISTLSLVMFVAMHSYAQKFSTKVTKTIAGDAITFTLIPDADVTTDFSTIEFFIKYPSSSPQATYGTIAVNTTNFPAMTVAGANGEWFIEKDNAAYVIAGYHVDHLVYTGPGAVTTSRLYTAGTEYDLITIPISGVTLDNTFKVVHQDSEASFYVALTSGAGGDLRPTSLNNMFTPTSTEAGPDASTIYYTFIQVPSPVKFTSFFATKKDNAALLTWQITNEDANVASYEVERSINGVAFTKVATVAPKNNGSTSNTYNLTDNNLSSVQTSGVIYYRIKQVDKDGRVTLTDIKSVRITAKGVVMGVYPNPVKHSTNLSLDLVEDAAVTVNLTDATGKEIKRINFNATKGLNVKSIDMSSLASGSYLLKVQAGTDVKTLPVVKAN